jgi:hypothetical protein
VCDRRVEEHRGECREWGVEEVAVSGVEEQRGECREWGVEDQRGECCEWRVEEQREECRKCGVEEQRGGRSNVVYCFIAEYVFSPIFH